ncbi:hypothetical protein CYFUS_004312 [Cystobacter fuscus]|uniref:Peptidase C51 domain-containing protein n=1 Tax=Cystobacter fuscus TaxID=43 RepID=A0A250J5U2_9BACT|nr:CHAP domain-containing protein [Cystobacter fuscus]ATB38877.1 hypothetical protein CYFUS_004312 [Cystobacter fuscus]
MKLGVLLAGLLVCTGCATGSPPGGRLFASNYRYSPLTPPAAPRPIPNDGVDSAPAPTASGDSSSDGDAASPEPRRSPAPDAREKVLAAARGLLGRTKIQLSGRTWPADCTGFVEAVHSRAGVSLRGAAAKGDNGVTAFYRYARAKGRVYTQGTPRPGDLVFFRETYDRNRDGRRNDGLTHVALVDKVEPNGTVVVIHRVKRGVVRYRMNLARPDLKKDPRTGAVLNDMLRVPGASKAPVLTGQLFAAYGSVLPEPRPEAVARR